MAWNNDLVGGSNAGKGQDAASTNIHPDIIPMFAVSELNVGRMVGQGGFCLVTTLERIELDDVNDVSDRGAQLRRGFVQSVQSQPADDPAYVVKTLRTDLPEEEYMKGILDLEIEANFLSVLSHPNIITMRACANSNPHESKFFVVLDRLRMTLDRKFNYWRKQVGEHSGYWLGPFGYCCSKEYFLYQTWVDRMFAARDVANALYFLHSKSIVFRDLKPDK